MFRKQKRSPAPRRVLRMRSWNSGRRLLGSFGKTLTSQLLSPVLLLIFVCHLPDIEPPLTISGHVPQSSALVTTDGRPLRPVHIHHVRISGRNLWGGGCRPRLLLLLLWLLILLRWCLCKGTLLFSPIPPVPLPSSSFLSLSLHPTDSYIHSFRSLSFPLPFRPLPSHPSLVR